MLNLQYIGSNEKYIVEFNSINKNIVQIVGDLPAKTSGFILSRIDDPFAFKGDYSEFKTVYREIEGGFQYSNDGSTYAEPIPKVTFRTNGGGVLNGETQQEARNYEDLTIPTPEAAENYVFTQWNPEIPESGEIESNKTFTAIFSSTLPEPEPDPTIDERITALENDVQLINDALGG